MEIHEKGRFGEDLACRHLLKKGFTIKERNFKCQYGEIDIIAENEKTLIFVEVKLRKSISHILPSEYVDSRKIKKISKTAFFYLGNIESLNKTIRFDIIEVLNSNPPLIRHLENAFRGEF